MTENAANTGNGNTALIRTVGLRKVYTTEEVETTALDNVNLEIADGEFAAIMGPSGCGKSTLLNLLGLLDQPDQGGILAAGGGGIHLLRAPAGEPAQGDDRLRLPVVQPDQRADRARERRAAPALHGPAGPGAQGAGGGRSSTRCRSPTAASTFRSSCPAASSSGWRWRGPWSPSRSWCSPTSRRATSTRATGMRSWRC